MQQISAAFQQRIKYHNEGHSTAFHRQPILFGHFQIISIETVLILPTMWETEMKTIQKYTLLYVPQLKNLFRKIFILSLYVAVGCQDVNFLCKLKRVFLR